MFRLSLIFALVLAACCMVACSEPSQPQQAQSKLQIVTTTGIIADAVHAIVGDSAEVISLMGPGVDPHLYKASQGDIDKLVRADLIVYNGLHLEGRMAELLAKLGKTKNVYAMSAGIHKDSLRSAPEFVDAHDPHIWMDAGLWADAVAGLFNKIVAQQREKLLPNNTDKVPVFEYMRIRYEQYAINLLAADDTIRKQIQSIPKQHRVLITAHDAFGYYGRAYGIRVRGLQGISTSAEYGLRDVSELVQYIVQQQIKAVFIESSISPKAIEAVLEGCQARGHRVRLGGTLFSDALDTPGKPAGTYVGMLRENTRIIVAGLK